MENDVEMQMLSDQKWFEIKNENGETFLHFIAKHGLFVPLLNFIKIAPKIGFSEAFKGIDNSGHTPMSHLIINYHGENWGIIFKELSKITELHNLRNSDGNTILHVMLLTANSEKGLKAILKVATPELLTSTNQDSISTLQLAAKQKILWSLKPLTKAHLKHGVTVLPLDSEGLTPMHYLFEGENSEELIKKYNGVPDEAKVSVDAFKQWLKTQPKVQNIQNEQDEINDPIDQNRQNVQY